MNKPTPCLHAPTIKTKLLIAAGVALISAAAWAASHYKPYAYTDHEDNKIRSGLIIYTDYYTGCQYLGTTSGGLVERRRPSLDGIDGKHMCLTRNSYGYTPKK